MIGDLHFGDKGIIRYRSQFSSELEHRQAIIDNWNSVVSMGDTVYVLGDAACNREGLEAIALLNGSKILIGGNHDNLHAREYLEFFDNMHGMLKYKGAWLTHCPIHEQEFFGKFNIHGHVHINNVPSKNYFNVSVENVNYTPIKYQEILQRVVIPKRPRR